MPHIFRPLPTLYRLRFGPIQLTIDARRICLVHQLLHMDEFVISQIEDRIEADDLGEAITSVRNESGRGQRTEIKQASITKYLKHTCALTAWLKRCDQRRQ